MNNGFLDQSGGSRLTIMPPSMQIIPRFYTALGYTLRMASVFCGVFGLTVFIDDALRLNIALWRLFIISLFAFLPVMLCGISKRCMAISAAVSLCALTGFCIWARYPLKLSVGGMRLLYAAFSNQFSAGVFYSFDAEAEAVNAGAGMFKAGLLFDCVFFIIAAVMSAIYIFCSARRIYLLPLILSTVICMSPALMFNLSVKNYGFALCVVFILAMTAARLFERGYFSRKRGAKRVRLSINDAAQSGFAAFAALILASLLMTLPAIYIEKPWWQMVGVYDYINSVRARLSTAFTGSGGDSEIGLGEGGGAMISQSIGKRNAAASERSYTGQIVLKVRSYSALHIYLRGWIGAYYSNNNWSCPTDAQAAEYRARFGNEFEPETLTYDLFESVMPKATDTNTLYSARTDTDCGFTISPIDVEVIKSAGYLLYLPTRTDTRVGLLTAGGKEGEPYEESSLNWWENMLITGKYNFYKTYRSLTYITHLNADSFIAGIDEMADSYIVSNATGMGLLNDYTGYVYDTYLNTDENEVLDAYIADKSLSVYGDKPTDIHRTVLDVIHSLGENSRYTLSPAQSSATEAVEAFLDVTKEGYCVQFATSAALILRRLGIPTRYCEGYITPVMTKGKASEFYTCDVRDRNAHSWIEVYIYPIGWMQYETTPEYYDAAYRPVIETNSSGEVLETQQPDMEAFSDDIIDDETNIGISEREVDWNRLHPIVIIAAAILIAAAVFIKRYLSHKLRVAALLRSVDSAADGDMIHIARSLDDLILDALSCLRLSPVNGEQPSEFCGRVDRALEGHINSVRFAEIAPVMQRAEFGRFDNPAQLNMLAEYYMTLRKAISGMLTPFVRFYSVFIRRRL